MNDTDNLQNVDDNPLLVGKYEARQFAEASYENDLRSLLTGLCADGNPSIDVQWAGSVVDWDKALLMTPCERDKNPLLKRTQNLSELLFDTIDYPDGPTKIEVCKFFLDVANNTNTKNHNRHTAQKIISKMIETWIYHNAKYEE